MVSTKTGMKKAPYFKPYGDPCTRASIPEEYERTFSKDCLIRSCSLWEEINKEMLITCWMNNIYDKHQTLDMSIYNKNLKII